jgi:dipeptidyl aminopeptidase/acylaminoacyl peptidase
VGADPVLQQRFEAWSKKYVFEILGAGQAFELPADMGGGAFSAMQDAADYYRTLDTKAVRLLPAVYGQVSWSPDGKHLAYGRSDLYAWQSRMLETAAPAISGSSGIEILDLETGSTRLLVSFGKDPAWSPDGKYIAFVREATRMRDQEEEVWLIPVQGAEPRRLALGAWPIWARDAGRLFFLSRVSRGPQVCSIVSVIRVTDPAARPEPIISCPSWIASISPDERYVAYAQGSTFQIVELASGSVVTNWTTPGPQKTVVLKWSADGKELTLGGVSDSDLGLWIFDVEREQAWHIFGTPAKSVNWSPDRTRMTVGIRGDYEEVWLAMLDPRVPTYQAVGPVLTSEQYLARRLEQTTRLIGMDPLDANHYLSRAIVYMSLHQHQRAMADMDTCDSLVRSGIHPVLPLMDKWAEVYGQQDQYVEAELLARKAFEIRRRVLGPEHVDTLESTGNLVDLYEAWGKPEEADKWRVKL